MTNGRRAISGLNGAPLIAWCTIIAAIGFYVLFEDLTGDGLKRTMLFRALGYFAYPIFYGCVAYGLYALSSMYRRRSDYVATKDATFIFGRTIIPLSDVLDVDVSKNWLGIKRLVVRRAGSSDYGLASYVLSRPAEAVAADLRAALTQTLRPPAP